MSRLLPKIGLTLFAIIINALIIWEYNETKPMRKKIGYLIYVTFFEAVLFFGGWWVMSEPL